MVNRNLLRQFDANEEELKTAFAGMGDEESSWDSWLTEEPQVFESNKIVSGKVVEIRGEDVIIDIGYKSEGVIKLDEWRDEGAEGVAPPKAGDTVEVLL